MDCSTKQWDRAYAELLVYRQRNGHCNVPTATGEDVRLGRWVAAQRYKRRINALMRDQIVQLDRIGFIWSPSDLAWERMFDALQRYIKQHGNANVPENYRRNIRLARWVQTQRHRRWKGRLSAERAARLDKVRFIWAVYKRDGSRPARGPTKLRKKAEVAPEEVEIDSRQRLYSINGGTFVQYTGQGVVPPVLERYVREHRGDYPPYIPLPLGRTVFFLGDRLTHEEKLTWDGVGSLPDRVLKHVLHNGTLPRNEPAPAKAGKVASKRG